MISRRHERYWPLSLGDGGALPPPARVARGGEGRGGGWSLGRGYCPTNVPPPPPPPHHSLREWEEGRRPRRWLRAALGAVIAASFAHAAFAQTPPPSEPQPRVTIGFVEIEGDPRHEPIRAYERLILKTRDHPFVGAQVGFDEAQAPTRMLKTD